LKGTKPGDLPVAQAAIPMRARRAMACDFSECEGEHTNVILALFFSE